MRCSPRLGLSSNPPFYEDTLKTLSVLSNLLQGPVSKSGRILRCGGLGFQHVNSGGGKSAHNKGLRTCALRFLVFFFLIKPNDPSPVCVRLCRSPTFFLPPNCCHRTGVDGASAQQFPRAASPAPRSRPCPRLENNMPPRPRRRAPAPRQSGDGELKRAPSTADWVVDFSFSRCAGCRHSTGSTYSAHCFYF